MKKLKKIAALTLAAACAATVCAGAAFTDQSDIKVAAAMPLPCCCRRTGAAARW